MAEPVALGIKPPQGMSLGDMLNLARGAQAYQQAEQANPLALQKAQMEIEQAQKLNPLAVRERTATTQTAEYGASNAQLENMLKHQQNSSRNLLKLLNDKEVTPAKIEEHVVSTMQNAGANRQAIAQAVQNLPKEGTDKELRAFVAKHATNSLSAEAQLEKLFPKAEMLNTGAQSIPIQMGNEAFTGVKPGTPLNIGIASQVGPTSRETLETDPLTGNKVVVTKDVQGNIISSRAAPAAPKAGGFNAVPAGESSATAEAAKTIQLQANKAALNVQQSQFNNNTIIGLADKSLVGANAETLAKLGGGYAVLNALDTGSATAVDNRQKLGHQLALETANLASGAGLNTDAARALGEKMSGDITWTPEAIKSTARMNRALTTGTDMFNRGVNAAVERAGNSPFAAREFQNKWSTQEQLVPTLQFVDALRNAKADPDGAKKAIESIGGYGSDGYKEMLKRAGKLNDLITKGQ